MAGVVGPTTVQTDRQQSADGCALGMIPTHAARWWLCGPEVSTFTMTAVLVQRRGLSRVSGSKVIFSGHIWACWSP